MATGVLFSTGWGMAMVVANHPASPTALILTSASSRTSRAAAFTAKHHALPMEVIGVTSAGNLEYTKNLGLYSTVITYEEVASLKKQKVRETKPICQRFSVVVLSLSLSLSLSLFFGSH